MLVFTGRRIFCLPVLLSKNIKTEINRPILSPVDVYGCETWSLTLRDERRLRIFENGVLKRTFGLRRLK